MADVATERTQALRNDLEREQRRLEKVRRIVELGTEIRAHLKDPDSVDDAPMYDDSGLPA